MPTYAIGIDLGTTNCVAAFARLNSEHPQIELLRIEQCTAPNQTEQLLSLPSFLYLPTQQEQESGTFPIVCRSDESAPTPTSTVAGVYARTISAEQPDRTIVGAKSWLCHTGVDRHSQILPWNSGEEVDKVSPVTASRLLLQQIIHAWHEAFPDTPFREQLITLTVPASFDMTARELTKEAALAAGFPDDFILLEEPQAAVYHWLDKCGDSWRKRVGEGDHLLVCDVGGGTTDLTLVRVEQDRGDLHLNRLAVGNHLLVGGDNMDLTLAHYAAQKFAQKGTKLNPWQSISLWHSCRRAKESLLSDAGRESETISVLGRGSKLIGGTVSIEVDKNEVQSLLLDGFFPIVSADAQPIRDGETGFQEIGLPFESDSAITRHIAAFLSTNDVARGSKVHLLLNGGVFKSDAMQARVGEAIGRMLESDVPRLSDPSDLDYAVARGAAFYGWTKQQGGVRIRGGTVRSYYVGIESAGLAIPGVPRPVNALCVVPFGMEEGSEAIVPGREVGLVVGRPAKFRFFASAVRQQDAVGASLKFWDDDELVETSPLELTLSADDVPDGGMIPVKFLSRVSELGVLELWCQSSSGQQWKLEFNVRDDVETSNA